MTTILIATRDGAAATLTQETVDAFRQGLSGRLLSPADAGFGDATLLWNGMIDKTPALVVAPAGRPMWWRRSTSPATTTSPCPCGAGGTTSPAPRSPTVADHRPVRPAWHRRDPAARIATVQAGCLLGEVDLATQEHGLPPRWGSSPRSGSPG